MRSLTWSTTGLAVPMRTRKVTQPRSVALDESGNVFVLNDFIGGDDNSLSELIGLATPVVTPVQSCVAAELADSSQYCLP